MTYPQEIQNILFYQYCSMLSKMLCKRLFELQNTNAKVAEFGIFLSYPNLKTIENLNNQLAKFKFVGSKCLKQVSNLTQLQVQVQGCWSRPSRMNEKPLFKFKFDKSNAGHFAYTVVLTLLPFSPPPCLTLLPSSPPYLNSASYFLDFN